MIIEDWYGWKQSLLNNCFYWLPASSFKGQTSHFLTFYSHAFYQLARWVPAMKANRIRFTIRSNHSISCAVAMCCVVTSLLYYHNVHSLQQTKYYNFNTSRPKCRCPQIFLKKSRNHIRILGTKVTWRNFQTEAQQILGATVQYSVALATWRTGFVHPCLREYFHCPYIFS